MALAATLSALRTLILDGLELPEQQQERVSYYSSLFPLLSPSEISDLAKISPQALAIYTRSIFTGEGDLIYNKAPMTWALLSDAWQNEFNARPRYSTISKKLHALRPWQSTKTEGLLENFFAFVIEDLDIFGDSLPLLKEVVKFERLNFYIHRAPNDEITSQASISPSDISALTVDQLLNRLCFIPTCLRIEKFDFDILKFRDEFYQSNEQIPQQVGRGKFMLAAARDAEHSIRWQAMDPQICEFLKQMPALKPWALSELAEFFASLHPQVTDEQQLFAEFLELALQLIRNGIIICPYNPQQESLERQLNSST